MTATDYLSERFPLLAKRLPRLHLASLPTPVKSHKIRVDSCNRSLTIKYDNLTGNLYGGNKVRKLEYIFPRASAKHKLRIATFGAVGSNHAIATALYARKAGFECTCFLSHQAKTPLIGATLNMHTRIGTELVHFGGAYATRLGTLRRSLWGRHAWVIPMGGSSWLGTVGFVAAGLELAEQINSGEIQAPDKLYVGAGTMGTAVGIALGLAIAKSDEHTSEENGRNDAPTG
jgi:D-cysteine desulfhydrase